MGERWDRARHAAADQWRRRLPWLKWELKFVAVVSVALFVVAWLGLTLGWID